MTADANREAYEAWNGDSGLRWVVDPDRRDEFTAPAGDALLAAAHLQPGEAVLDVGCGCGATTLAAASAVGPRGTVDGIDLSEPMLDVARQRVDAIGFANVTLEQADAQTHALETARYDAAIGRFGTMFFDDPGAAFSNIARSLRSGGRLAVATWQPLLANDWLTIPGAALLAYGSLPDAGEGGPGMFAQSDPAVIRATLEGAGFRAIDVRGVTLPLRLGADPDEATAHLADTGVGRAVLATIPANDVPDALRAVTAVLADHHDATGVYLGGAIWITTASAAD